MPESCGLWDFVTTPKKQTSTETTWVGSDIQVSTYPTWKPVVPGPPWGGPRKNGVNSTWQPLQRSQVQRPEVFPLVHNGDDTWVTSQGVPCAGPMEWRTPPYGIRYARGVVAISLILLIPEKTVALWCFIKTSLGDFYTHSAWYRKLSSPDFENYFLMKVVRL